MSSERGGSGGTIDAVLQWKGPDWLRIHGGPGMVPFEQLAPRLSSPQRLPSTIALGKKNNYNAVCIVLSLFFPVRKIKDYR